MFLKGYELRSTVIRNLTLLEGNINQESIKYLNNIGSHAGGIVVDSYAALQETSFPIMTNTNSTVVKVYKSYKVIKRDNTFFILKPFPPLKNELNKNEIKILQKNKIHLSKGKQKSDEIIIPLIKNKDVMKIFQKYKIKFLEDSILSKSI